MTKITSGLVDVPDEPADIDKQNLRLNKDMIREELSKIEVLKDIKFKAITQDSDLPKSIKDASLSVVQNVNKSNFISGISQNSSGDVKSFKEVNKLS